MKLHRWPMQMNHSKTSQQTAVIVVVVVVVQANNRELCATILIVISRSMHSSAGQLLKFIFIIFSSVLPPCPSSAIYANPFFF